MRHKHPSNGAFHHEEHEEHEENRMKSLCPLVPFVVHAFALSLQGRIPLCIAFPIKVEFAVFIFAPSVCRQ
jgi:hypothetical protein